MSLGVTLPGPACIDRKTVKQTQALLGYAFPSPMDKLRYQGIYLLGGSQWHVAAMTLSPYNSWQFRKHSHKFSNQSHMGWSCGKSHTAGTQKPVPCVYGVRLPCPVQMLLPVYGDDIFLLMVKPKKKQRQRAALELTRNLQAGSSQRSVVQPPRHDPGACQKCGISGPYPRATESGFEFRQDAQVLPLHVCISEASTY